MRVHMYVARVHDIRPDAMNFIRHNEERGKIDESLNDIAASVACAIAKRNRDIASRYQQHITFAVSYCGELN